MSLQDLEQFRDPSALTFPVCITITNTNNDDDDWHANARPASSTYEIPSLETAESARPSHSAFLFPTELTPQLLGNSKITQTSTIVSPRTGIDGDSSASASNKKYQCQEPSCSYSTNRKTDLKRHKDKHFPKKRWRCGVRGCEQRYSQKWKCKDHIADKHAALVGRTEPVSL